MQEISMSSYAKPKGDEKCERNGGGGDKVEGNKMGMGRNMKYKKSSSREGVMGSETGA